MEQGLIDKSVLLDTEGRPLTQSLFLEIGYSEYSVYTLKDFDHEYNNKIYPSLKRLYLLEQDPTEYEFANKYLLGWRHWQRLCENKQIRKHIDEWREELEFKLRSKAVKSLLSSAEGGNYQAAKWFADRGWDSRAAGRPTKAEKEGHLNVEKRLHDEYGDDVVRLFQKQGG